MVRDETRKVAQVVSPFEQGDDPAATDLGGELAQPVAPGAEAVAGDAHAAQGIGLPGIEAGGEEEGVGSVLPQGWQDAGPDGLGVAVVAGAGGQGDVEGGSLAGAGARLARGAGAGV